MRIEQYAPGGREGGEGGEGAVVYGWLEDKVCGQSFTVAEGSARRDHFDVEDPHRRTGGPVARQRIMFMDIRSPSSGE